MKKIITSIFIVLFSVFSFAKEVLPSTYTLTNADYELVGNGKYHNFDIREGKYESDPLVILRKLNQILDAKFTYTNGDTSVITFATYNGARGTDTWSLYVENLKFRTSDYVLDNSDIGYINLGTNTTLDICTWNIEHYPKDALSEEKVKKIILDSEIDVFALQEISNDKGAFDSLLQQLGNDYAGYIYNPYINDDIKWDQNIAFIYKKDEISVTKEATEISEFKGDTDPFPRTPYEVVFRHKSGIEFVVINIHLKCCDGSEDRRRDASKKLKNYIDKNYTANNTAVVLLGDMNDRIDSKETDNVFSNFIDDSNYIFTDAVVSEESTEGSGWANIDHILINKPLFNIKDKDASKLEKNDFDFDYDTFVSDHFPVWVNLNPELLGIESNYSYKSKLNIYPNPASGNIINFDMPNGASSVQIIITNTLGQEVLNKKQNSNELDISKYPKGCYFISLKSENIFYSGKFTKK